MTRLCLATAWLGQALISSQMGFAYQQMPNGILEWWKNGIMGPHSHFPIPFTPYSLCFAFKTVAKPTWHVPVPDHPADG